MLLAACQEPVDPQPQEVEAPKLVSADPADGASDIEGATLDINLTFDQNVKCPDASAVTVSGGALVDKVHAYNTTVTVTLSSLSAGVAYTLTIPEGTIRGFRENQNAVGKIVYTFTVKADAVVPPSEHYELDPVAGLTNPKASRQTVNVYKFLLEQSGERILSGVQSSHSNKNDFVDVVYHHTGKHPALAGYDFIFLQYSPTPSGWTWVQNYNDISAAKEQWENNGLVNYMWHWNVPSSEAAWKKALENYGQFDGYAFYSDRTSFDINAALTEGTWQNDFIMKDIEEVAGYLQLLEDEGIPVIWRPLHEAAGNYDVYGGNGAWFWWGRGGAEPCKKLWRLLYDQLVNVRGLDNLIWVWTVDVTPGAEDQYLDWYPGDEYVDIVGVDIYESDTGAKTRQYQALVDMTKGRKLVTVSECGNIPDPGRCNGAGNKWSWFMVWPSTDSDGNVTLTSPDWPLNTPEYWKEIMNSAHVINREDMPSLK